MMGAGDDDNTETLESVCDVGERIRRGQRCAEVRAARRMGDSPGLPMHNRFSALDTDEDETEGDEMIKGPSNLQAEK